MSEKFRKTYLNKNRKRNCEIINGIEYHGPIMYSQHSPFHPFLFHDVRFYGIKPGFIQESGNLKYKTTYREYILPGSIVPQRDRKLKGLTIPKPVVDRLQLSDLYYCQWWLGFDSPEQLRFIFLFPTDYYETESIPTSLPIIRTVQKNENSAVYMFKYIWIWPEKVTLNRIGDDEKLFAKIPGIFLENYGVVSLKSQQRPNRPVFTLLYDDLHNLLFKVEDYMEHDAEQIEYRNFLIEEYSS